MVYSVDRMLWGEYRRILDDKHRVAVPAEWREILGTNSIFGYRKEMSLSNVSGNVPCLVMGRGDILDKIVTDCQHLLPEDQVRLDIITTFIINRFLDEQGRLMLRGPELDYLKIDHPRIVLYGNLDRFIVTNPNYSIHQHPPESSQSYLGHM